MNTQIVELQGQLTAAHVAMGALEADLAAADEAATAAAAGPDYAAALAHRDRLAGEAERAARAVEHLERRLGEAEAAERQAAESRRRADHKGAVVELEAAQAQAHEALAELRAAIGALADVAVAVRCTGGPLPAGVDRRLREGLVELESRLRSPGLTSFAAAGSRAA